MKKLIVGGCLLLSSTAAFAEGRSGFYLTPSIGTGSYDISHEGLDDLAALAFEEAGLTVIDAESSLDDRGTPWSLVAGWQFSRYFAAEVGYLNLGKARYEAEGTVFVPGAGLFDGTFDMDITAKGPTLALAGIVPIGQKFDLHGKGGVFFAKTKLDFGASVGGESESDSFDSNSKDFFLGVGAAYHFTDRMAATVDYHLYKKVGDEQETGEGDVDAVTLGVVFKF